MVEERPAPVGEQEFHAKLEAYVASKRRKRPDETKRNSSAKSGYLSRKPVMVAAIAILGIGLVIGLVEVWLYDLPFTASLGGRHLGARRISGTVTLPVSPSDRQPGAYVEVLIVAATKEMKYRIATLSADFVKEYQYEDDRSAVFFDRFKAYADQMKNTKDYEWFRRVHGASLEQAERDMDQSLAKLRSLAPAYQSRAEQILREAKPQTVKTTENGGYEISGIARGSYFLLAKTDLLRIPFFWLVEVNTEEGDKIVNLDEGTPGTMLLPLSERGKARVGG
jgi:hypothetical protein